MSLGCLTYPFAICRLGCRNTRFTRDTQWLLRFAEGALDICEPFGIGVIFEGERPLRMENLELC